MSIKVQRSDLAVLTASLIWGFNYSTVKIFITYIPPLVAGLLRFFFAAIIILFLLKRIEGSLKISWPVLRSMIIAGVIGFGVQQIGFLYGSFYLDASLVALFTAFSSGIMTVVSARITHEPLTRMMLLGVGFSCLGMIFVVLGKNGNVTFSASSWIGLALVVGSGIISGTSALLNKKLLVGSSPLRVTTWTIVAGSLFFMPLGASGLPTLDWGNISWIVIVSLLFTAVGGTAIANILWNYGIAQVGVVRMTIYSYLSPILGILLAIPLLHEHLAPVQWLGAACTLGGVMLAQYRKPITWPRSARLVNNRLA